MIYLFERFELDEESLCLSEQGQRVPVEPKALRVLILLVSRHGRLVEKDAIFESVWKGTFVEESTLTRVITLLRKQLGDDSRKPRFIETVPTLGYRFIATVTTKERDDSPDRARAKSTEDVACAEPVAAVSPLVGRRFGFGIAGAGLLVVMAAVVFFAWGVRRPSHASAAPDAPVTLAILPISNQTGDPSLDAPVDGLTEDLIRQMSEVPHLKVISETAVFGYRGQTVDVRAVGQSLHVTSVLTSSIRRSGAGTVMDIELSNVSDGSVVLSRQYLPEESDLRPVRTEIVQDILAKLHLAGPDQTFSTTSNSVAYQDYLAGEGYLRRNSPAELHRAIPQFEQALALDPKFASAWGDLGETHLMLGLYFESPADHMPEARRDLDEALKLDPERPEFHGALGLIHLVYDWNYPAAASELSSQGREDSAFHLLACSIHLMHQAGEADRAEETLRRMEDQAPGVSAVISELGCVSYYRRKYPDAVAYYRKALDYDPGSPIPYWGLGKSLAQENKFDEAVKAMQQFEAKNGFEPPILTAEMGYALGKAGRIGEAREKIATLEASARKGFMDPYLVAVVYLGMGDRKAAFAWLEKAYVVRSSFMISIVSDPKWDTTNTDPRFAAIVRRMNIYQTG